jgi:hypothetical protein
LKFLCPAEQAEHKALLKQHSARQQVADSNKKNASTTAPPKGVAVLFYGAGQNIDNEHSGQSDTTEMDTRAKELRDEGWQVIEISSAAMQNGVHYTQVSPEALQTVLNAVLDITGQSCNTMPVEIEAFSKGSGGAVALTNALTDKGYAGSISTTLIDPFVDAANNLIKGSAVNLTIYQSTKWSPVKIGYHLGFEHDIRQGSPQSPKVQPNYYPLTHGGMDTYVPGALGPISLTTQGVH